MLNTSTNVEYKIVKHIGTIYEQGNVTKEINLVSWNNREPVADIRKWIYNERTGKKTPRKGISMDKKSLKSLKSILQEAKF